MPFILRVVQGVRCDFESQRQSKEDKEKYLLLPTTEGKEGKDQSDHLSLNWSTI